MRERITTMKIRIRKYGIEIWRDVSRYPIHANDGQTISLNWRVTTIYFNPVDYLRYFVRNEINDFLISKKDSIRELLK